jgi:acetylornithine/N-succinyldiaminopimelate aminotransferase
MPNYRFVPYNDVSAMRRALDDQVAAVILEPIQGEGGIRIPDDSYLKEVSKLCRANRSLLIVDEIQTGFCRTGPMFAINSAKVDADFLTMAKGIAGGFPLGAFAVSEAVADKLEAGDHGGTYCGNPLGCAVACAVIKYLLDHDISTRVMQMGSLALDQMSRWTQLFPAIVRAVRGRGLLLAIEFCDEQTAGRITDECLSRKLFVRQTQGNLIRIFPALNIRSEEMKEGLAIIEEAIGSVVDGLIKKPGLSRA